MGINENLTISKGLKVTGNMEYKPKEEGALKKYFKLLNKGEYYSITRKDNIKSNIESEKGVKALQSILISKNILEDTKIALKEKPSVFREKLESIIANGTDKLLFSKSLDFFDNNDLSIEINGIYSHNTRLAVAYFQFKNNLKIDGVYGKNTETKFNPVSETKGEVEQLNNNILPKGINKDVYQIILNNNLEINSGKIWYITPDNKKRYITISKNPKICNNSGKKYEKIGIPSNIKSAKDAVSIYQFIRYMEEKYPKVEKVNKKTREPLDLNPPK